MKIAQEIRLSEKRAKAVFRAPKEMERSLLLLLDRSLSLHVSVSYVYVFGASVFSLASSDSLSIVPKPFSKKRDMQREMSASVQRINVIAQRYVALLKMYHNYNQIENSKKRCGCLCVC